MVVFRPVSSAPMSSATLGCSSFLSSAIGLPLHRDQDDRGDDHVEQTERQQDLPAEAHEHVVAKTREGAAEPDVEEYEEHHLEEEGEYRWHEPQVPAAEEQQRGERRDRDDIEVLGEVVHRELEARVLGQEAADKLLLRLRQVEW